MNTKTVSVQQLEAQMKTLQAQIRSLKAKPSSKVEACEQWVAKTFKGVKAVKRKPSTYTKTNGETINTTDIEFSNGKTFRVAKAKFWVVK